MHTDGEEAALYPELEQRCRHVGAAYLHDHREEHELFADVQRRIADARDASAPMRNDALKKMRRQFVALTEHVQPHVRKEDALITPLLVELFTPPEQAAHIGRMMASFPPEVLARTMPWMMNHLDPADRIAYVAMIARIMPSERLAVACGWIRAGISADAWSAIAAGVPNLPA
jgi:hypothetical protein